MFQERALDYLTSCIDQVNDFNDILQLVIVELVYKVASLPPLPWSHPPPPPPTTQVCHANPSERARFIRCIYNLLNSSSAAVRYEAAGTLVTLSSSPTAIKVLLLEAVCSQDVANLCMYIQYIGVTKSI